MKKALLPILLLILLSVSATAVTNEVPDNFTIAIVGDLGVGPDAIKVYEMLSKSINNGELKLIVLLGDLGYEATPREWEATFNKYVPTDFPVMITLGNHEYYDCDKNDQCASFNDDGGYKDIIARRFDSIRDKSCKFDDDRTNFACDYKGVYIVGLDPSEPPYDDVHKPFLYSSMENSEYAWQFCVWHKENGRTTTHREQFYDHVDIKLYDMCRYSGAMIMAGHIHEYERTKVWADFENVVIKSNDVNNIHIGRGYTYSTIAGTGGRKFAHWNKCPESGCPEFAKLDTEQQGGKPGVLFMTLNADGQKNKAFAQFINIEGKVRDEYTIWNDKVSFSPVYDNAPKEIPKIPPRKNETIVYAPDEFDNMNELDNVVEPITSPPVELPPTPVIPQQKLSILQKISSFFRNLFGRK